MARSRLASAHACAALVSSFLIACGDPGAAADPDGGALPLGDAGRVDPGVDAARPERDAAVVGCRTDIECDDGDPSTSDTCAGGLCQHQTSGCTADWDCTDWDACTLDTCVAGSCAFAPITDCAGCHSDAECDDGNPSTTDLCDTYTRACSNFPNDPFCSTAADCDDHNPCTGDQCNSGTCAWGSIGTCCFRDTDCNDYDRCTADTCDVASHGCAHEAIPGCGTSSCMDVDGDGHGSNFCFPVAGDDCNDFDASVHPGATELCDNGVDDDCDGMVDGTDDACASHNTMCGGATMLALPGTAHGVLVSPASTTTTGGACGTSLFYSFSVTETSDVDLTIRLGDLAPPPTCPGCPPTNEMHQIWHNLLVERTCGDAATAVASLSSGSGCYVWDPSGGFFGGSRDHTLTMRRLAPGTYTIEVQAKDWLGWRALAIPFDLTLSATPSEMAACDGAPLVDGASVHATTVGAPDAFGLDCSGAPFSAPERVHAFDLATRSRVRLIGTPTVTGAATAPGMQLALRSACDPDTTPTACVDTNGYTCQPSASIERILDPGHYFVEIDPRTGTTEYDLTLLTETVGAACAGAPVIAASGSLSGDNTGRVDHFRWNEECGGGAAGEVVYSLEVAARSRVVLDLIASASTPVLRVLRGCGDATVAGSAGRAHIDTTLEAGTYQVVVDGGTASDVGTFVLNATLLAM
ncbi:MAG: putative metal-binding motif-containing protein [Sandaracinus sp.]